MKKKKKQKFRVTKKDKDIHRKLLRRESSKPTSRGIWFDKEKYLLAVATIKRKLLALAGDIAYLLANAGDCIDRRTDIEHAREYVVFARERLGDTEFFFTDTPQEKGKKKLHRRKKKLNRRRMT